MARHTDKCSISFSLLKLKLKIICGNLFPFPNVNGVDIISWSLMSLSGVQGTPRE